MNAPLLAANLAAHWIQAGVLAVTTLCALRLLRVKEPRIGLAVLQILLVLIVLLPWVQPRRTREKAVVVSTPAVATATITVSAPLGNAAPPLRAQNRIEPSRMALAMIAAGTVLRLVWLLVGF